MWVGRYVGNLEIYSHACIPLQYDAWLFKAGCHAASGCSVEHLHTEALNLPSAAPTLNSGRLITRPCLESERFVSPS